MNDYDLLYNKLDAQDKIINTQALEIARLKSIIEKWELGVFSNDEELQQRIDNAINYIKWHYDLGAKENVEFCLLRDRLLEILKEKENENNRYIK